MKHGKLIEGTLTRSVIGAFFEVYNTLGYGFLEHLYVMALERELLVRGHTVAREISIHVMYKGEELGTRRLGGRPPPALRPRTQILSLRSPQHPKTFFQSD
ncbi:MAG: GxxExxY protein [Gemmatimonadaceae bacterium]|nr:GxxExxY protein [Gemmatimonadaceae bacterium]